MTKINYTVFTINNNTERTTTKSFNSEIEAINYAKLQIKRKLGKNYKEKILPFKGRIIEGYFDKEGNFEFHILKYIHEDEVRTTVNNLMFEI